MIVLMIPYLYFRKFSESSGVIHQSEMAKALASLGANVVVVLPPKDEGWEYDAKQYFGGYDGISCVEVKGFCKNQILWAGFGGDGLQELLSPLRAKIPYDVVFSGNPPTALMWKRLLTDTGFSRVKFPLYSYFDWVHSAHSRAHSRVPALYHDIVNVAESACAGCDRAIVTTKFQYEELRKSVGRIFAPSLAREMTKAIHYVKKPIKMPPPTKRTLSGTMRVFLGSGFSPAGEDNLAKYPEAIVDAISVLSATGKPVQLVVCTASEIVDWTRQQIKKLGSYMEFHHRVPHAELVEIMRTCHVTIDLRQKDSLYMASIEQACSGAVNVVKDTECIRGEVDSPFALSSVSKEILVKHLGGIRLNFDECAEIAYASALVKIEEHSYERFRCVLDLMEADNSVQTIEKNGVLLRAVEKAREGPLFEVIDEMRRHAGGFGRTPLATVVKVLRSLGLETRISGPVEAATWSLVQSSAQGE